MTKFIKIFLLFNFIAIVIYVPMSYLAYYISLSLAIILVIIASGVSAIYMSLQISKAFEKSGGRVILGFIAEMVLVIGAWYFLYSFIVLQQGKITPLINPSSINTYKDYTFFHLKDYKYDTTKIVYYQSVQKTKDGGTTYTNYYVCPIINQNQTKDNLALWLGYDKTGRNQGFNDFKQKIAEKPEYFAKYALEQDSYKKAIRKKTSKEISNKSIIVYGVDSPEKAKQQAWQYVIYLILTMNIIFVILWIIFSFYDEKAKDKK